MTNESNTQPKGTQAFPELTSKEVNDACWTFVEQMPHQLPGSSSGVTAGQAPAEGALTDKQIAAEAEAVDNEPAFVAGYTHGYRAALSAPLPRAAVAPLPEASPATKGRCNTERACAACFSGQGACSAVPTSQAPAVGAEPHGGE